MKLDREGVFKAIPVSWRVQDARSGAAAVSIEFKILAMLGADDEWEDWSEYEECLCFGDWWVVKKDGGVNESAVSQLGECLGWAGSLRAVGAYPPPETVVQIRVEPDTFKDNTRYRATWMYPEDAVVRGAGGASPEKVKELESRFGSLLRAAASAAGGGKPDPQSPDLRERVPAGGGDGPPPPISDDDIPFAVCLVPLTGMLCALSGLIL